MNSDQDKAYQNFHRVLGDAALQYRFMQAFEQDEPQRKSGRVLYAIDSDMVALFCDPAHNAVTQGRRLGYGQVFSSDSSTTATAIARIIADEIFTQWHGNRSQSKMKLPLIVPEPLLNEVASQWRAVQRNLVKSDPPQRFVEEGLQYIKSLEERNSSSDVEEVVTKIVKLYYLLHNARQEFDYFRFLLESDSIASEDFVRSSLPADSPFFGALRPLESVAESYSYYERAEQIRNVIENVPHAPENKNKLRNLRNDALVLARVELWNRRLAEGNVDGRQYKVVYISGARHVYQASMEIECDIDKYRGKTLAECFIRHPRGILATPDILRLTYSAEDEHGSKHEQDFYKALKTFVVGLGGPDQILEERPFDKLRARARNLVAPNSDHAKMVDRWNNFCGTVSKAYFPAPSVHEFIKQSFDNVTHATSSIGQLEVLREMIDGQLRGQLDENWEEFFQATVNDATIFGVSATIPRRSVPPVYFDSWPNVRKFVALVSRWHTASAFDVEAYQQGIADTRADTSGEEFQYAYYLAHAVLFAAREQWDVAVNLCDHSIERLPSEGKGHADGREANYLMAYCTRHSIRSERQMVRCREYLSRARDILALSRRTRDDLDVFQERFEAEELAVDVTEWMFLRYSGQGKNESGYWIDKSCSLSERIWELRERVGSWETARLRGDGVRIQRSLLRNLNINLLNLWLSQRHPDQKLHGIEINAVVADIERLRQEADTDDFIDTMPSDSSLFVQAITTIAKAMLPGNRPSRNELESALASDLRVFPYDLMRYRHFLAVLNERTGIEVDVGWIR